MTEQQPTEGTPSSPSGQPTPSGPPRRRSPNRVVGAVVLLILGGALFYGGVDTIAHPAETVAESSNTPRSPDSEEEAKLGGVIMCLFGVSVFGFGVSLCQKPKPKGETFGSPPKSPPQPRG